LKNLPRTAVCPAITRARISTVGSGNSFLGGLVRALESTKDASEALGDAVAAGTANALSEGGGQFTLPEFKEIQRQVKVEAW
jgi:fructose-1-phosphate kinase PfkB-like protein